MKQQKFKYCFNKQEMPRKDFIRKIAENITLHLDFVINGLGISSADYEAAEKLANKLTAEARRRGCAHWFYLAYKCELYVEHIAHRRSRDSGLN